MAAIRICPERDTACPHGVNCPWAKDRHSCQTGWRTDLTPRAAPAPDSAEARYKAEVDRVNRITDREIDEALTKFPKVLAALHESEKADVAGAIERLTNERDVALRECVRLATEAGSAKGKLEASEAAGIVDGWREKCERLEASLTCVLPMAKGYAHANPVGRNAEMIAEASRLLGTEGRDDE